VWLWQSLKRRHNNRPTKQEKGERLAFFAAEDFSLESHATVLFKSTQKPPNCQKYSPACEKYIKPSGAYQPPPIQSLKPHKRPPTMPPIRSARTRKPPPEGFDDIEDTLLEFSNKMKDAENASHEGKKRGESLWPIFQISHARRSYLPTPLNMLNH
jgi:G10 protein